MSFTDKFVGLMARPGDDTQVPDGTPWYFKYGVRVLGIVAAFFAILFGLYNCFYVVLLDIWCLVSGIIQMLVGFIVMGVEAPFCCMFIEHAKTIAQKADERPLWNRAGLYCLMAIPPIVMCPGIGSIFGCGLVFLTGAIYGMISLGKKGTREDMAAVAGSPGGMQDPTMMHGQQMQSTDHQVMIEDPDVWRPT